MDGYLSYCRQLSPDIEMKNYEIKTANNFIMFYLKSTENCL